MKKLSIFLVSCFCSAAFSSQIRVAPIVVTASKSTQSLKSVTSNIDIITSQQIRERGFFTLPQVLSAVSGIQVLQNGGLGKSSSVKVRGFDSKAVLVLIDGVRYNDPTSVSGANFSNILIDDIDRIEILKGAQSGVWGADASAGVINIITKRAYKDSTSVSIFGEYGSFNTKKYGLNSAFKRGGFDFSFDVVRLDSDGFSAKVPSGAKVDDFEDDGYENTTSNIKLGYDITDKDRVEGFFNYTDAVNEYDGYDKDAVAAANDALSKANIKEKLYGLKYKHIFTNADLKIYANRSKFSREYVSSYSTNFDGSVDETGINSKIDYTSDGFVSFGVDYKRFEHENKIDKSYKNEGIFLTNSNEFDGLIDGAGVLTESLRYDKFDAFENKVTYKIGIKHIHKKIDGLWSSFNYATAYNVPTLYQLHDLYVGNEELNPQKTKGWDVTVNYKGVAITYFDNSVEDIIDYDFTTSKYANIAGESTLKGVELSYEGAMEDLAIIYSFNYTYLQAKDKDDKRLPRRAKNSANFTLDYYGVDDAHIGILAHFLGKREKSSFAVDQREYPSFTVVDLSADYKIDPKFSLYAKIDNLLDKRYQQISGYATSKRAFYLGFRYEAR